MTRPEWTRRVKTEIEGTIRNYFYQIEHVGGNDHIGGRGRKRKLEEVEQDDLRMGMRTSRMMEDETIPSPMSKKTRTKFGGAKYKTRENPSSRNKWS